MRMFVNIMLALALLLPSATRASVIFEDSFENGFAPGWYGRFDIFQISATNAHIGTHSVTTNGLWHWLAVDLGFYQYNTTYDCWFYDAGTNNEEHMVGVSREDPCCGSQPILWIALETNFDRSRYMYGRGWTEISSEIPRSTGWHKATFYTDGAVTNLSIDNQLISTETFAAGWRYIVIWENSKLQEPHTMNFWDDVKVYTDLPVPALPTTWGSIKAMYK